MDNLLEFLDKDRQRMFDFANDIVTNGKLSEKESIESVTSMMNEYNENFLTTVENIKTSTKDFISTMLKVSVVLQIIIIIMLL
jgi:hypothetical protein